MKILIEFVYFAVLITLLYPSSALAINYWNDSCLRNCFATGHDCNFCAYECERHENGDCGVTYTREECPLYDGCPQYGC